MLFMLQVEHSVHSATVHLLHSFTMNSKLTDINLNRPNDGNAACSLHADFHFNCCFILHHFIVSYNNCFIKLSLIVIHMHSSLSDRNVCHSLTELICLLIHLLACLNFAIHLIGMKTQNDDHWMPCTSKSQFHTFVCYSSYCLFLRHPVKSSTG